MKTRFLLGASVALAMALWLRGLENVDDSISISDFPAAATPSGIATRTASEGSFTGSVFPDITPAPVESEWRKQIRFFDSLEDAVQRSEAFEQFVAGIGSDDRIKALEYLLDGDAADGRAELVALLMRSWVEQNPREASEWIARQPENALTRETACQAGTVWANADLPAATAWVKSLPAGDTRIAVQTSIAYEAARTDFSAAIEMAAELPDGHMRDALLKQCVRQWVVTDGPAAFAWAREISSTTLRQQLLAAIAVDWAESDPHAAASAAVAELAPGEQRDGCIIGIVQRWSQKEPGPAAEWIGLFPDGTLREIALEHLTQLGSRYGTIQQVTADGRR
jgi:hypothetical protein